MIMEEQSRSYVISESELKEFYYNRKEYLYDFLKSKQPVQKLDRKMVEKILYKNAEYDNMHSAHFFRTACEICNLIPEQPGIDRDRVEKAITKLIRTLNQIYSGICDNITGNPMKDYVINQKRAIDGAIDAICKTGGEEMKQDKIDCYDKTGELIREGKCTCLTCVHVAEMKELLPNDKLRNKVLAVTNEQFEAMAAESMDLGMEVIDLKKQLSTAVAWHSSEVDRADKLQSQLDNISELKIVKIMSKKFDPEKHLLQVMDIAKAIIKLKGEQ